VYCAVFTGISTEIMAISVDSGRAEKAGILDGSRNLTRITPDDRIIAGVNLRTRATYEWEFATAQEKILGNVIGSEDGRWLLDIQTPDRENRRQMRIRPVTGTEADWKLVAHFRGSAIVSYGPSPLRFAPDGSWVIYRDRDPNGKDGLYRVFTANGEPERLGDYPVSADLGFLSVNPDGRQIIVEGCTAKTTGVLGGRELDRAGRAKGGDEMKTKLVAIMAVGLLMAAYAAAQNVSQAELQFREALHKQQVEGDLTNAIKIYQDIVASKAADRGVKAKALLQLAACYEKLGRQSETVYQQILRDFADQPAATQARTKLAALKPSTPATAMTMRKIDIDGDVKNVIATDGQRAVYWDSTGTTLYIGDIAGKDKRVVYKTQRKAQASVSRDLSLVFFFFQESEEGPAGYGIVKTDGTGYRDITLTENGRRVVASAPFALSWSWDNRFILICQFRADRVSHLLKMSVADGSVQDMISEPRKGVFNAQFSPDGRFIAFVDAVLLGLVQIIRSDGGAPKLIATDAALTDWTRDGRYLMLFKAPDLKAQMWAAPIRNGEAAGEPILVRSSLPTGSWKTAPNGTMILQVSNAQSLVPTLQIHSTALDSQNRLEAWKRIELVDSVMGPGPLWPPDGRQIVYVGKGGENPRGAVRVYTMSSGEDREIYRSRAGLWTCVWSHTRPGVYCGQIASEQKTEIVLGPPNLKNHRAVRHRTFALFGR
jgi:Tol biopolymer transport system component